MATGEDLGSQGGTGTTAVAEFLGISADAIMVTHKNLDR